MEKKREVVVSSVLNDCANPGCASVETFNMKTVVDISESETEGEMPGDDNGYESVANLRTKRKHDVFKHLLTGCRKNVFGVRRSPRIAKNKATSRFNNTADNPICLDSPDMGDVLASQTKKESSCKQKIELEKNNDKDVRVTISNQTRKDDESVILASNADKGESSSKRKSETVQGNEIDAGNSKSNQKQTIADKRAKHGKTPSKQKAIMEQTKAKKRPKIFVPAVNEDPDDDFMDTRTVKSSPLPPKLKVFDGRRIIPRNTPRHIWGVIKGLTDEQKEVVRGMGFEAFLEMKITQIPTALSYWLLNNYDVNTQSLVTPNGVVKIDEKLINSVLGVPIGTEEITSIEKPTDKDPVAKEWRSQFREGQTKITLSGAVVEMIGVSNVNEVKNGVVDKGYVECSQGGLESDWNLGNTDLVERGKGEYKGNAGNKDSCGKCIDDSLNGNEDKGTENVAVAKEPSIDLADMVKEGDIDINLCDAVNLVVVEAKHLEDGKTESAKEYVNEEEHLSVLIDEFKMDTQEVDYYRAQFQSQPSFNVDDDGNVRIPLVSQYGPTQDFVIEEDDELADSYREEDRLLFIKKCISDFQDCYIQVQNTLRIAEREYPNSDGIRQQKSEWGLMVKQLQSKFQTQGNSVVCGSTSKRGVDAMHKSGGMTPTWMGSKVGDERLEAKSGSGLQFGVIDLGDGALGDGKTPCEIGISKKKTSMIEHDDGTFKTPEQIVNPLACYMPTEKEENLMGRPKRSTTLPDALRSPFANNRVLLNERRTVMENNVGNYIFSSYGSKRDIVYSTERGGDVMRVHMESLCPGVKVHANVISAWSTVLNNDRQYRRRGSPLRLFCSTNMLVKESYMKGVKDDVRIKEFTDNMEKVLKMDRLLTLYGIDMVFIPVIVDELSYVLSFNLKKGCIDLLDNNFDGGGYWKRYKGWPEMMFKNMSIEYASLDRTKEISKDPNNE
ncbi:hypothetical protein SSX86_000034 [Deinandra increscens subsp. villosa]|uniref:Uncharacterized protein n=1 Tax=Deinandra increscens subsp. villosa TaxID=3103831 RepID=A0AAP0DSE4_9ASTR